MYKHIINGRHVVAVAVSPGVVACSGNARDFFRDSSSLRARPGSYIRP